MMPVIVCITGLPIETAYTAAESAYCQRQTDQPHHKAHVKGLKVKRAEQTAGTPFQYALL